MSMPSDNSTIELSNIVSDSFIGTSHRHNEDKILALGNDQYVILAVFDGVGSAKNNYLATELSIKFIRNKHSKYYSNNQFHLEEMIIELNHAILSHPQSNSSALSTCAICVYICNTNTLIFLTLGDTRIYAVGKHYATRITEDDVIYPGSNVITKCLGLSLDRQDISEKVINNFNDDILICSDGFYKLFEETKLEFFEVLLKKKHSAIKNNMQELVKDRNNDDASYVLFKNV